MKKNEVTFFSIITDADKPAWKPKSCYVPTLRGERIWSSTKCEENN